MYIIQWPVFAADIIIMQNIKEQALLSTCTYISFYVNYFSLVMLCR